uniref:Endonuclease/exonuclease/phosphatase domain-containing protein n=1 Tax=Meloidogyne enterolobii TaxID=390850 RepID=A0A6V7VMS4_MELEN|nr:unnamed protein product [Meloidogyne enterolobii]
MINETWLNNNNTICPELTIMGKYEIVLANRTASRGGGALILITKEISFQEIFSGTKFQCELNHIKLLIGIKTIHLINIYRPPNCLLKNTKNLLNHLSKLTESDNLIYCGDFNIRNIDWQENKLIDLNDPLANLMLEFIDKKQLKQFVREPTRENSILDIILSNNIKIVQEVEVLENFSTSDHKIVKLIY